MRLNTLAAVSVATPYFLLPLFPAFITLAPVSVPGISLLSPPVAQALLAVSAFACVMMLALLLRAPRSRSPLLFALAGWLGAAFAAALLGFNPLAGALFIAIFALGMIWHSAILKYYGVPVVRRTIFWSYMLSGALASATAIVMVAARYPAQQYAIGHGRAIGTFILPGELAGYLIVFLPVALTLARIAPDAPLRAASWTGFVLGTVAFVLTYSRAGWMGLAASAACYAIWNGRVRRWVAPASMLAGLGAVLLLFNAHHNPAENYTRLSIWQAGIEMARRFPLTGVGPFNFASIYPLVRLPDGDAQAFHAHNFLLTIFAETGIVGVLAVAVVWWRFAVELRARVRLAPPAQTALALAIAAGLAGTWVQGLIDTVSVVIFGLWLPSMALALAVAASESAHDEKEPV